MHFIYLWLAHIEQFNQPIIAIEISVDVSTTSSTTHVPVISTDDSTVDTLGVSLGVIFGLIVLITAAAIIGLLVKIIWWKRKRKRPIW